MFNAICLSYFSPNSRIPNSEFRFDDPQIIEESNRSFNQNNISEQICHFSLNSFEFESIPVKIQHPNQNLQNDQTQYQNQQPNSTKSNPMSDLIIFLSSIKLRKSVVASIIPVNSLFLSDNSFNLLYVSMKKS